ncbi:MAG: hypothetical protein K5756_01425 [Clostridiales bacterium]|nr:hypothetical protein [Clostridiales bacterium]
MSISYKGFNNKQLTFKAGGTVTENTPVKLSSNDTVSVCSSGDEFAGIAGQVRNGLAAVQMSGAVTLPYTGTTTPTVGYISLAADGEGGVKVPASGGKKVLAVNVDTTAETVTFIY